VLDGQSGLLVPENDPSSLAGAIRQLIRDNEDWPTLGAAVAPTSRRPSTLRRAPRSYSASTPSR